MRMVTGVLAAAAVAATSSGVVFEFSVLDNIDNQIGTVTFRDGDVVQFDTDTGIASIVFNEDLFGGTSVDITAYHRLPNGNLLLSVLFNGRTLGGLTFDDGDLVEYDPVANTATFAGITESTFDGGGNNPDISAVSVLPSGDLVFSTFQDQSINGVSFTDGDLVQYNPMTDTATVIVTEASIFDDGDGDIDAVHALADGTFLISPAADDTIDGVLYTDSDVVTFDPATGSASLFFTYDEGGDVNAFFVPAPADCPGDANGDNMVNFDDLNAVLVHWETSNPAGDVNESGFVDFDDLNEVLNNWEQSCS